MNKLLYNQINIPQNIDIKIQSGIDKARYEKNNGLKKKRKRFFITSAACFSFILILGMCNPALASQIPLLGNIFELLGNNLYFPGPYKEYSTSINEKAYSNGINITISEALCDGQSIYLTYKVENNKPFKYLTWGDDSDIGMNQLITNDVYNKLDFTEEKLYDEGFAGLEGKFLDPYTFIGVQKYSLDKLETEIPDKFTLQTKILNIENYSINDKDKNYSIWGNWSFKIPITVNKALKKSLTFENVENTEVKINNLSLTPFDMILEVDYKEDVWHNYRIKVFDENEVELLATYSNVIGSNKTRTVLQAPDKDSKEIRVVVEKSYISKYGETLSEVILDKVIPLP